MKTRNLIIMSALVLVIAMGCSCGKGWQMDYGKPAAQFLQADLEGKGKDYVGKKITVKGVITKIDLSDPNNNLVYLGSGIKCKFSIRAMAQACKVGETIYVDGFLENCEKDNIVIDPAMSRDSKAAFNPK